MGIRQRRLPVSIFSPERRRCSPHPGLRGAGASRGPGMGAAQALNRYRILHPADEAAQLAWGEIEYAGTLPVRSGIPTPHTRAYTRGLASLRYACLRGGAAILEPTQPPALMLVSARRHKYLPEAFFAPFRLSCGCDMNL